MRLDNHFTPILLLDCLFELANIHHVPFEGLAQLARASLAGPCAFERALLLLGLIIPLSWWRILALTGAILSLVMLVMYLHPFFGVGIGASIILLIALLSKS